MLHDDRGGAMSELLYKICDERSWREAEEAGRYAGSAADRSDGFIHLSGGTQVRGTAARHFAGQADLLLVGVDAGALGPLVKWEVSRGGELFPHLYADLPMSAVAWVKPLPLSQWGEHVFPELQD